MIASTNSRMALTTASSEGSLAEPNRRPRCPTRGERAQRPGRTGIARGAVRPSATVASRRTVQTSRSRSRKHDAHAAKQGRRGREQHMLARYRNLAVPLAVVAAIVLFYMENPWFFPADGSTERLVATVAFWVLAIAVLVLMF